ncbi:MAG: hypothetical protein J6V54_10960 [Bacteroidales bacterium]|nr:hypothetical protein [Bacteroidales bacterium]
MNNKFDILEVARRLGLNIVRNKALCPIHNDHRPSMTFRNGMYFKCWACSASGDAIDLVRMVRNCSFAEAVDWIEGNSIDRCAYTSVATMPQSKPVNLNRFEYLFDNPIITKEAADFLFNQRGLDKNVISDLRISSNHTHIAIPYFDMDGHTLISIQWRYLGCDPSVPRFVFTKGCQPSIYNLPLLSTLKPDDDLYISEGSSDCWALLSDGHKAIAIPSATSLKSCINKHIDAIARHPSIYIFPDDDLPGEALFMELKRKFPHIVKLCLPTGCKDYSDFYSQTRGR